MIGADNHDRLYIKTLGLLNDQTSHNKMLLKSLKIDELTSDDQSVLIRKIAAIKIVK